ncbi:hypothetical protein [Rubrivirga marina]|nr:hypothetical protein [Rubrivirga marina]
MSDAGLTEHLRDAIRLNRARRAGYRRRGGLRADLLSRALVAAERALLPAAWLLDRDAARHPVPVLRAELVDMAVAPPAHRPIPPVILSGAEDHTGPSQIASPRAGVGDTRSIGAILLAITRGEALASVSDRLSARIAEERRRERAVGRRRALTIHLLESARLSAARAADYARRTDGATLALSRRLVLGHLALVPFARGLDRLAAPVHDRGVGLFVNDVPPIPEP